MRRVRASSPSGSTTTNSSGVYTITGLTAGTYTLTIKGCTAGTYFTKTIPASQVAAGKTTTENVTLVQPGTITGKITNSAGKARRRVRGRSPSGGNTTTNSSGVYTIAGLAAGTYKLTIKGCTAGTYLTKTITGVAGRRRQDEDPERDAHPTGHDHRQDHQHRQQRASPAPA